VKNVRVAVIGTGWWATAAHLPAICAHPEATLAAIADARPERLAAAAAAFGNPPAYTDHRALLAEQRPDAVVVATTHASHHAVAADSLDAGCHVLVEKPLTLTARDAADLVDRARRADRHLLVGYPYNHNPLVRQACEWVATRDLGPLEYAHGCFNSQHKALLGGDDTPGRGYAYPVHGPGAVYSDPVASGGGHGHLQLTHLLGVFFQVVDVRMARVNGRMANHGLAVDMVDAAVVEFEGGALGTIGGTCNAARRSVVWRLGFARGSVVLDLVSGTGRLRGGAGPVEEYGPVGEAYPQGAPVDDLVNVALGRCAPLVGGVVGWRAVEVLDALYRSARAGGATVDRAELEAVGPSAD